MKEKVKHIISRLHPRHVSALFETFLKDESISGKLILVAALTSLVVVNSPLFEAYNNFWHLPLTIGVADWTLSLDLRHWLNEGLMAFFFLVVGLEIKRELVKGELRDYKTAILPIGAAIGGMVTPALIYLAFNVHTDVIRGWGIPIATDIAFAIAILTILGRRVPTALKIFLLTLAIADDIGAIIVIALFYAEIINYGYLLASIVIVTGTFLLRKKLASRLLIVVGLGVLLWTTTHLSGIHASIVGAAMGLLAPVSSGSDHRLSASEKAEKLFLPITTFFILPLFAFANAGFTLNGSAITSNTSVVWGIICGLVFGKVLGISGATWILTKLGVANLPKGVGWKHIIGVGFIAGIGFTVSIFITELAFSGSDSLIASAKAAICIASIVSAVLGVVILKRSQHTKSEVNL